MEFTCLTCSKDFATEEIIRQHIIDEHNGKPIEVDMVDEMEVFQCDTCLQEFLSEECVKQHIRCCWRDIVPSKGIDTLFGIIRYRT